MVVVAPEIVEEARRLSTPVLAVALTFGVLLWLLGGWAYRFWLVMGTTLVSGILGLTYGEALGVQPLVAGLLLAVAVGALALSLARIGVFVAVGLSVLFTIDTLAPSWSEPKVALLCFFLGGLSGIVLFRLWVTVLTSLVGAVLMLHAGLALVLRLTHADVLGWTRQQGPILTWSCGAAVVLGVALQFLIQRRLKGKGNKAQKPQPAEEDGSEAPRPRKGSARPARASWWPWRQAG